MRTLEDIGQETKAKHPGKYDHLSDAEVGRRMFEKYPERYPDVSQSLQRTSPQVPSLNALTRDFNLPEVPVEYSTDRDIQIIVDHYSPNHGRLSAWWQRGKAESRNRLLSVLNEEQLQVIEQGAILEDAIIRKKKSMADYQMWVVQNAVTLREIFVNEHLIDNALKEGLTVVAHQPIVVKRITDKMEIDKYERIAAIDLNNKLKEMQERVRLAIISKYLSEMQKINIIQDNIDGIIRQQNQIEKDETLSEKYRQRMIDEREEIIEAFKEDRRARQRRLVETHNGGDVRGVDEDTDI